MAFLTTVKTTGELFDAAIDLGARARLAGSPLNGRRTPHLFGRATVRQGKAMHLEVLGYALLVRASNVAATHR
jgi:hypothetical protein